MKFIAFVKNELQESVPVILFAAFVFLFIASYQLLPLEYYGYTRIRRNLIVTHNINNIAYLLWLTSIACGFFLALVQFGGPVFFKTWAFTIHRSLKKSHILYSKFTAAIIGFLLAQVCPWLLVYLYVSHFSPFPYPPSQIHLFEGLAIVAIGYIVYLATAFACLNDDKWYKTKALSVCFALAVAIVAIIEPVQYNYHIIIISLCALALVTLDTFLNKEF